MQWQHKPASTPPHTVNAKIQHEHLHYHMVFNHIRSSTQQQMAKRKLIPYLSKALAKRPPRITCTSCAKAKLHPARHSRKQHRYNTGEALSSDVCGPFPTPSRQGNQYFMTVVDTNSRYLIITLLQKRDQASDHLDNILSHLNKGPYPNPSTIHTDNAKEYLESHTKEVHKIKCVQHTATVPYTLQENGIAERVNRTITNAARASLHHSGLLYYHWEDAIKDSVFKYNHTLHLSTGEISTTLWHGQKPSVPQYMIFGQLGHIPHITSKTLVRKFHA